MTLLQRRSFSPLFSHPWPNNTAFDPIHFGLLVVMSLVIGLITPPVGVVLYITCGIGEVKVHRAGKFVFFFVGIMILTIFIIAAVPQIAMFLPNLYSGPVAVNTQGENPIHEHNENNR